jgi:hypothetical protein
MSEYRYSNHPGYTNDTSGTSSPSGHEGVDTARKAAEALFAPKRPMPQPAPDATESPQQETRKPRILSAIREQPAVVQPHDSESTKTSLHKRHRARKRVPTSQLARVRTWLTYGMTIDQAADVCGVSVSEIERIL